ncbi:MAG: hypothetical protein HFE62_02210 [Firmicutes bacterium]|nr:hypothetical protein [Bacillota bacterium]
MEKLRQSFVILMLFVLLTAVAVAPVFVTNHNNERLLGNISVKKLPEEKQEISSGTHSKDVKERIKIIKKSLVVKTFRYKKYQNDETYYEKMTNMNVLSIMEEQLSFIQNLGLSFDDGHAISMVEKTTYMDTENPNEEVSIWKIDAEYNDFYITAYIDAKTNVVYEIIILLKKLSFIDDSYALYPENFIKEFSDYLEFDYDHIEENEEQFSVGADWSEFMMNLFILSVNETTGELVEYSIERSESIGFDFFEESEYIYPYPIYERGYTDFSNIKIMRNIDNLYLIKDR